MTSWLDDAERRVKELEDWRDGNIDVRQRIHDLEKWQKKHESQAVGHIFTDDTNDILRRVKELEEWKTNEINRRVASQTVNLTPGSHVLVDARLWEEIKHRMREFEGRFPRATMAYDFVCLRNAIKEVDNEFSQ